MVVATIVFLLHTMCRATTLRSHGWPNVLAWLSFLMALVNVLVLWHRFARATGRADRVRRPPMHQGTKERQRPNHGR